MLGGGLFSRYFLDEGIRTTDAFTCLDATTIDGFRKDAHALLGSFVEAARPSEAETEHRLIFPLLQRLGWHLLPQQADNRRENIPDALLFLDRAGANTAMKRPRGDAARFLDATIVHESKAWDVALDRAAGAGNAPRPTRRSATSTSPTNAPAAASPGRR